MKVKMKVALLLLLLLLLSRFSHVRLCVTPLMAAHQALQSLGFSRQEYWSGLPLPSPIMIKGPVQKGDITVVNMYASNIGGTSICKANTNNHKGRNQQ